MSAPRSNLPVVFGDELPLPRYAQGDEDDASPGISLAQLVAILRAHWKHSVLLLFGLILVFALIIKVLPESYVATATLIVNRGDKDPLASSDAPIGFENTFIPTQVELIRSAVVLNPVITQLHLLSNPEFTHRFVGPPAALREAVRTNLHKALKVTQGVGSDLLYVAATAKHPVEAASIANAVAAEYLKLEQERIDRPAVQRARVYSQELADLRHKAIAAQDRVTAFRQKHRMIELSPKNADEAEEALRSLEQKLLAAENQQRSVEAELQSQAGEADTTGAGNLASKLALERSQLAKLRRTLGPRHPEVLELEAEIAATRQSITSGLSAQLADARKLVAKYSAAVNAQRAIVLRRRRAQDQGSKLLLELESAETTYKRALDGYSRIEFASQGNVTDVSLVSPASPPVRAVKPNKIKYFLASCVFSFGLAFGGPLAYELFANRRLRCRDDLERHFGIPVIAQFGPIEDDS